MLDDVTRFKVILLGDSGVGKSSLLVQFTESKFASNLSTTIGIDYKKTRLIIENQPVVLDIWDTAGQERYRTLTRNHFRNAQISSRLNAPFMESSAKENINVRSTFRLLAKMMLDERKLNLQNDKMEKLIADKLVRLEKCDCCQRSIENSYKTCCTQ
eukprot:sb/3473069/